MGKTINTILNLTDRFTPKLTEAGRQTLVFKQRLKNCDSAAVGIDKSLAKLAKGAAAVGAAGAAAMGAFAVSSVKTYKEFQQSMSNVAGIKSIATTSEEYKSLEKAARQAGRTTTKTAKESADALSYMSLAGWTTEASIKGLMPVLRASEATGADLATTSDLVTDSMSALGLQVNELDHYLDVCARAQNRSNTTLTQMQEAYIACGGTFKSFNTPLQESGALLGILANRGIKGSEAGNALQSTLVNLTKKSGESYKAMQALGISAYDANGDFRGVTTVLEDLKDKTAGLTEEQRNTYLTMIGGKNQLTTLNALMAGLSAVTEEGKMEFEELYNSLGDCDGALNVMANTMTNNLNGAMARAQSATDDFKITIGEKLEPYVTQFFNWFAEKLPGAAEKFSVLLDSKLPKAISFTKSAFETVKPVMKFVINNFSELASVGAGVIVGLKAFSILTKVNSLWSKFNTTLKGVTTVQKLATVAQVGFNTSLLACPLTWVAVGLAAVVGGVLALKSHLEKADIAEHFGNITLSAEECGDIVKGVFGRDILNRVDEAADAYEQLQSSLESTSDSAAKLNKLNFQIEFGGDVNKEDYLAAVEEYTDNLQQAINDSHYSLKLDIDLLFSGNDFGTAFSEDVNEKYSELIAENTQLGNDLKNAVEEAYNHNWEFDYSEAVVEALKAQSEMQAMISAAQSEAKLETLRMDFAAGDLSYESFQNLVNETNAELQSLKETYNQARIDAIAAAKLTYGEGTEELANAMNEANAAYNEKVSGLMAKGLQFESGAIMDAYKDEFAKAGEFFSSDEIADDLLLGVDSGKLTDAVVGNVTRSMDESFNQISDASRKHIGELYAAMAPSVEEMQTAMQGMEQIPEAYAQVFAQANMVGAVGKNADALKATGVTALSRVLPSDQTKVMESSKTYGQYFIKGITSEENIAGTETAANVLKKTLTDTLSKKVTVNIPIGYNFTGSIPKVESTPASGTPVDSNAVGTSYFGGGFTRINENGGEIINLPTGTQIIPADKSEKMVGGGQNISVVVQVMGHIFGTEDAAEIIGNQVLIKLAETVRAM